MAETVDVGRAAEARRERALQAIETSLRLSNRNLGPGWRRRLVLGRAVAHAGLAAVSKGEAGTTVRRFALSFCLRALASAAGDGST